MTSKQKDLKLIKMCDESMKLSMRWYVLHEPETAIRLTDLAVDMLKLNRKETKSILHSFEVSMLKAAIKTFVVDGEDGWGMGYKKLARKLVCSELSGQVAKRSKVLGGMLSRLNSLL